MEALKKTIYEIGTITDPRNNPLLKMWKVQISSGTRPLTQHQHLCFELMMVNAGSGIYCTKMGQYSMQSGDLFVFPSNEWHCITEVGAKGLTITNLQFDPTYIGESLPGNAGTLSPVNSSFCFHHKENFCHRIEAVHAKPLAPLFTKIKEELEQQAPGYVLSVKSYLNLFLVTLIRKFDYLDNTSMRSHEHLMHLQLVFSYIDEHLTENLTLRELADISALTPTYFSQLFKEIVGVSLWNYISSKRIDKAVRLITAEDCNKTMLEIATECGFNNTVNFNKTFKKIMGMSPREYKNGGFIGIS